MLTRSRKKRIAVIAGATALVVGGGGVAFAFWSSTGHGEGTATTGSALSVGTPVTTGGALSPGAGTQTVTFSVTNPAPGSQVLNSLAVTIAEADGISWTPGGCTEADFTLSAVTVAPTPVPVTIASLGVVTGTVTVSMKNAGLNQDACQGLAVPLHIVAS